MNRTFITLHALAIGVFLTGCSSGESTPVAARPATRPVAEAPVSNDADIRAVMAMLHRGELTETQALRLIATLRGMPVDAATPVVAAPIAPVAPATAPAPTNAAVPAVVATTPAPVGTSRFANASPIGGYKPGAEISGRIRSAGSDSMDLIMENWAKGFVGFHPKVRMTHEGMGSSTAVPALLEGRAEIGPMSRPLKRDEITQFEQKFGYAPTQVRAAMDALAIYVHPSNPILKTGLTLKQLDAIFSDVRRRGGSSVTTWGDLGLTGEWKGAPVRVYSRNDASGTYSFFRDAVLEKGEFRSDAKFLAGSAEVVSSVGADKFAIGYSGIGFKTAAVGAVNIAADEGSAYMEPNEANAVSGEYPISRALYVTINRRPGEKASDLYRELVTYILSEEGQAVVKREGYFSLPAKEIPLEMLKLRYNVE